MSFLTSATDASTGLLCPNCAAPVLVPEGLRVTHCQNCDENLFVQGERGVRRWQVHREIERTDVEAALQNFYRGIDKARDLRKEAEVKEIFLAYLPYWRVRAIVAGWRFGTVKVKRDKSTVHKPVEREVYEEMHWCDAATDVSEFGVHRVEVEHRQLEPFESQRLHAEGMVFEPTESYTDALAESERFFIQRAKQKSSIDSLSYENYHFLRRQLSIIYYPLWITRYAYKKRTYTVVIDGVTGEMLYGKAPGNTFFRAAMLNGGMALGNFVLVNGTAALLAIGANSNSNDGAPIFAFIFPIVIGFLIMRFGYNIFRYSEEIEKRKRGSERALKDGGGSSSRFNLPGLNRGQSGEIIVPTSLDEAMRIIGDVDEKDLENFLRTISR